MELWHFIQGILDLENINQKQFSIDSGIDEPTLTKIKNGGVSGRKQLPLIAKYLNIELTELKKRIETFNRNKQNSTNMDEISKLKSDYELLKDKYISVLEEKNELLNELYRQGKEPGRAGTGS